MRPFLRVNAVFIISIVISRRGSRIESGPSMPCQGATIGELFIALLPSTYMMLVVCVAAVIAISDLVGTGQS